MMPTIMNSVDLKSACEITMPMPARAPALVPMPTMKTMNPSWETVP